MKELLRQFYEAYTCGILELSKEADSQDKEILKDVIKETKKVLGIKKKKPGYYTLMAKMNEEPRS